MQAAYQLDKSFAVSPPYLDYLHLDDVERLVMKSKINNWLKDRILQWGLVPARTRELIDFLFATIYFHQEYLNLNLHTECRFRASSFFKDIPQEFLDCAMIAFPWTSTQDTPKITGVPPHVLLMAKVETLLQKFSAL